MRCQCEQLCHELNRQCVELSTCGKRVTGDMHLSLYNIKIVCCVQMMQLSERIMLKPQRNTKCDYATVLRRGNNSYWKISVASCAHSTLRMLTPFADATILDWKIYAWYECQMRFINQGISNSY